MLIYEYKLDGSSAQNAAIDEAIRVVQFIRNKCLRLWMDKRGISKNDLQCYCTVLAKEYTFAHSLNSQARQVSADRAWFAISRFYDNCKNHKPGKKGYPRFQHDNRSIEYKHTGWKIAPDGKHITLTDGCGVVLDRDHNAAINILAKALERTLGHRETSSSEENASGQTASTRLSLRKTGKRAG